MRVMDAGLSFPPLVLALAVVAVLGPGLNNTALALAVVFTPSFVRLIRGQTLAVREESFVEASRALGSRPVYVVGRRVFPNVAPPIIVQASLALGGALLAEAALSFLGSGRSRPSPAGGRCFKRPITPVCSPIHGVWWCQAWPSRRRCWHSTRSGTV